MNVHYNVHHVADSHAASMLAARLTSCDRIALDCEAAGYHRYSDRLCLVQVSTPGDTWLVDTLALDARSVLRPPLEDPECEVLMHGASFDLRLLSRDLGIRVRGLFDTQVAAAFLGEKALGLSALLKQFLGVHLGKKYQRADWAIRPLPEEMLAYAADDTRYLHPLVEILRARLVSKERLAWAREEFRWLEQSEWKPESPESDPAAVLNKARDLPPRALERLRALWTWRDEIARRRDRAPFRVASDQVLIQIAQSPPDSVEELARRRGLSPALVHSTGKRLFEHLEQADALPEARIAPYASRRHGSSRRLDPQAEAQADKLRRARSRRADDLGLDPGLLLPNKTIVEIARADPTSMSELARVPNVRAWQVEALGGLALQILRG